MPTFKPGRSLVIAVTSVALLAGACKKGGSSSTKTEEAKADEADALGDKLDGYIECYNNVDKDAHDSMRYYARWLDDPEKGPTGKEKSVSGVHEIGASDVASCKKKLEEGKAKKPALPDLEAKAGTYLASLEALQPKAAEAKTYYDRKDYQDDKFAKAKAMHAPLWQAFLAFDKASDAFSDALEAENDKSQTAEIAAVEKRSGKKLYWQKLNFGQKAKNLLHDLNKENPDPKKAEEVVNDFTKTTDEMLAYAEAHADEKPSNWSTFESKVKSFVEEAKDRMRTIRDKKPLSSGDKSLIESGHADMVTGHAAKLSSGYNAVVAFGNGLRFKD